MIYVPGKLTFRRSWQPMDPDAAAYIAAVETADGQALEEKVKIAIDNFFIGCKEDGTWPAIKASCILAAARTIPGALVPLLPSMPTPLQFGAPGGWNYDRKLGLKGNGTDNYLNSGRSNSADAATNHHLAAYAQQVTVAATNQLLAGYRIAGNDTGGKFVGVRSPSGLSFFASSPSTDTNNSGTAILPGAATFLGLSRIASGSYTSRNSGITTTQTQPSTTAVSGNIFIFGLSNGGSLQAPTSLRLPFYSIGESLNLTLLDTRVTTLINAIGAAIP